MKITYIFPTRSRKEKAFTALDNIHNLSESDSFEIIMSLDLDDTEMNNDEVKGRLNNYQKVTAYYGAAIGKIGAINRELDKISADTEIVCLHSDDFVFTKQGFDNDIKQEFMGGFGGLLHYPDQRINEQLCTYPIMSKGYLEMDNFIYHPQFISVYADNFQQDLAKSRCCYKYVDKNIFRHEHYRNGYAQMDNLMKRNESPELYRQDRNTYFDLKKEYGLPL